MTQAFGSMKLPLQAIDPVADPGSDLFKPIKQLASDTSQISRLKTSENIFSLYRLVSNTASRIYFGGRNTFGRLSDY